MNRDTARLKAVLVLTAAIAFAVSPFLVSGFDGFDPSDFPIPQEAPAVQPAGYAFAIWGVIYVWLIVHAFWGLVARSDDPDWDQPRWPLFGSLALGASWLAVANASPPAATVQIWAMLILAIAALARVPERRERALLAMPVGLYAGWLTAASWVSVGLMLGGFGLTGETAAAIAALAGATATAALVLLRLGGGPLYGAAVAWGLLAIAVANLPERPLPALLAAVAAGLAGWLAYRTARRPG